MKITSNPLSFKARAVIKTVYPDRMDKRINEETKRVFLHDHVSALPTPDSVILFTSEASMSEILLRLALKKYVKETPKTIIDTMIDKPNETIRLQANDIDILNN